MRIKFIGCDVFARLAYAACATSPHRIDLELLPMLKHEEPAVLCAELQTRIDRSVETNEYDKIILGYGLCGNAVAGLTCTLPLIMPRVHDCCTLFMGSREAFNGVFGENLSMRWCSCGYYERCFINNPYDLGLDYHTHGEYLKLLEDYGEENAEYVWQTMHPPLETNEAVYIWLEGYEYSGSLDAFARQISDSGKSLKVVDGEAGWFQRLVNGPWDSRDFLELPPGSTITPVYDMERVVEATKR